MLKSTNILLFIALILCGVLVWVIFEQEEEVRVPQYSSYSQTETVLKQRAAHQMFFEFSPDTSELQSFAVYPVHELKAELNRLVARAEERDQDTIEQYLQERSSLNYFSVNNNPVLQSVVRPETHPLTTELLSMFLSDIEVLVSSEKLKHNVARPMQMDVRINTTVDFPERPAYPSLHASKLMLISELLNRLAPTDVADRVAEEVEQAIERTHVVGVSTRFDTEYGVAIARAYLDEVIASNPKLKDFLVVVQEREWSVPVVTSERSQANLPDVRAAVSSPEIKDKFITFLGSVDNAGSAAVPGNIEVEIQFDRFADGIVDSKTRFYVAALKPGEVTPIGYTRKGVLSGTHRYRFVVDPDFTISEQRRYNNYSDWYTYDTDQKTPTPVVKEGECVDPLNPTISVEIPPGYRANPVDGMCELIDESLSEPAARN